ncbi:uncharacterized protein LOC120554008 [Perca fluviatilis]|uniref:uncharacterized protein LOC120554008 n=1 Tax=Perca fluviatilis TaxID=8168 RepID=UPI001966AA51|nr:uncharacterized protein LOC120554008 [Perca fluviatilis]
MPHSCIYPGCGLKAKKFHPESFYDLPFRYKDPELLQQWLVVLKMDITTPLETLKKKRYRVCSRHFYDDDFYYPSKVKDPKKSTRALLKRNAIPRVGPPAADIVEAGEQQSGQVVIDISDMIGLPQSTPTKSHDTSVRQSTSKSLSFGLPLTLTSPEPAVVRPRTQRSLSGTYVARPPTWNLSEELGATSASCLLPHAGAVIISQEEEDSLQEMSTSFGEWRLDDPKDDPKDDSYKPPSDTSPSDSGSASTSSHGSINGWSERKWIVESEHNANVSNLLPLWNARGREEINQTR